MKKEFDIMEACSASALDFINTVLFCMKEDGFEDDVINSYKEYLFAAHEMHYNTDIGEQCENIENYLDECNYYDEEDLDEYVKNIDEKLTLLQEEDEKIIKWLKENGYTDECIEAEFEPSPINDNQGRAMDFKYKGNIEELDVEELAASIAENVIDERFSVRVFIYDEDDGEAYRDVFCVEIWLNE